MVGPAFPSWAYNQSQPAQIVQSQAQFNALGPGWSFTPFVTPGQGGTDPGLTDTDIRLQQILVENRISNQLLQFGFNLVDDPQLQLRPDILANDSSLTS
jgi:hypothetical protein